MARKDHVAERQCILTRESRPQGSLLRFVLSPDGLVVPDLKGTLPGRGMWLTATRSAVEQVCASNGFSRAARQAVTVPENLSDLIENQLVERCLNLLGLAKKAGNMVTGFEKVRAFIGDGSAAFLIAASDASDDGKRKLRNLNRALPVVGLFTVDQLSLALGRQNVVHAAVRSGGLAVRFLAEAGRLAAFRGLSGPAETLEGESE